MNFLIKLLLSPAQARSDLTSCNSNNLRPVFSQPVCKGERHNSSAEEPKTRSPAACPRSPTSVAERSKSSSHTVKEKPTLPSSFSLPLLYLVLLRQKFSISASDKKTFFFKASESMLWPRGPNPGICVFLRKNRILMQSGFCRHSAPL